jgi:hypothetical protein
LGTIDGRLRQSVHGYPLGIFAHNTKLYLFAVWSDREVRCQVLAEGASSFELERTVRVAEFGLPASVIDMDSSAEKVVLGRPLDLNAYWLFSDLTTGLLRNIGASSDFGFFLTGDVLGRAMRLRSDAAGSKSSARSSLTRL